MFVIKYKKNRKASIETAAEILRSGGVIVYPTETAYGLGCDARNTKAVRRIYEIKGRPAQKAIPIIVASAAMAQKYLVLDKRARKLIKTFMPGPLTLVVRKKRKQLPDTLSKRTVAFRISSNRFARELAKACGCPITSTSANPSGANPIYSAAKIMKLFAGKVDLIIDAGNLKRIRPSTIVDLSGKEPRLLREGPIAFEELKRYI